MEKIIKTQSENITTDNWTVKDAEVIYELLEKPNWAPWLAASKDSLVGRSLVFPQGQLVLKGVDDTPLASLSTNQIFWNGQLETLPTWDEVAGDPTTYAHTYKSKGNTLVLMSMNVHPEYKGIGLARTLTEEIKKVASKLNVDYLIGSFRPTQFGKYKSQPDKWSADFADYCKLLREDKLPIDSWLRNLIRNGMIPLTVDKEAMAVETSIHELWEFMQVYNMSMWNEVMSNVWECGEVGQWTINPKSQKANYRESNLWGTIPFK